MYINTDLILSAYGENLKATKTVSSENLKKTLNITKNNLTSDIIDQVNVNSGVDQNSEVLLNIVKNAQREISFFQAVDLSLDRVSELLKNIGNLIIAKEVVLNIDDEKYQSLDVVMSLDYEPGFDNVLTRVQPTPAIIPFKVSTIAEFAGILKSVGLNEDIIKSIVDRLDETDFEISDNLEDVINNKVSKMLNDIQRIIEKSEFNGYKADDITKMLKFNANAIEIELMEEELSNYTVKYTIKTSEMRENEILSIRDSEGNEAVFRIARDDIEDTEKFLNNLQKAVEKSEVKGKMLAYLNGQNLPVIKTLREDGIWVALFTLFSGVHWTDSESSSLGEAIPKQPASISLKFNKIESDEKTDLVIDGIRCNFNQDNTTDIDTVIKEMEQAFPSYLKFKLDTDNIYYIKIFTVKTGEDAGFTIYASNNCAFPNAPLVKVTVKGKNAVTFKSMTGIDNISRLLNKDNLYNAAKVNSDMVKKVALTINSIKNAVSVQCESLINMVKRIGKH